MASRRRGTPRPHAEARPTISGTATLGQVLTCNDGVWIPQPITITRQWIRDASTVIVGATAATYTLVAADQTHTVKCRVTGSNGHDATTIDTASTVLIEGGDGAPEPVAEGGFLGSDTFTLNGVPVADLGTVFGEHEDGGTAYNPAKVGANGYAIDSEVTSSTYGMAMIGDLRTTVLAGATIVIEFNPGTEISFNIVKFVEYPDENFGIDYSCSTTTGAKGAVATASVFTDSTSENVVLSSVNKIAITQTPTRMEVSLNGSDAVTATISATEHWNAAIDAVFLFPEGINAVAGMKFRSIEIYEPQDVAVLATLSALS